MDPDPLDDEFESALADLNEAKLKAIQARTEELCQQFEVLFNDEPYRPLPRRSLGSR
jgi:hypothetical protein